jgi:hypothetical protein
MSLLLILKNLAILSKLEVVLDAEAELFHLLLAFVPPARLHAAAAHRLLLSLRAGKNKRNDAAEQIQHHRYLT